MAVQLPEDLCAAIQDDRLREARDAAKKRAVAQHVDYEAFKNMVAVAHLRPLQAPAVRQSGTSRAPAWSCGADGTPSRAPLASDSVRRLVPAPGSTPRSLAELQRAWRRDYNDAPNGRLALLRACGAARLAAWTRAELPLGLLDGAIRALAGSMEPRHPAPGHPTPKEVLEAGRGAPDGADAAFAADMLDALSGASGSGLAVRLLSAEAREALEMLLLAAGPLAGVQQKQRGTVKWFNSNKGFGFLSSEEGGDDLFVHQSSIDAEGFRSLREGEAVEFFVETGEDGRMKAVEVTGPDGAPPQGAPRRPYQGGHEMGPMAGPMAGPALVSYGYGPPMVYHPGYPIRGGFPGPQGRGPPYMGGRGGFNGRGAYPGRGPYGGRGGPYMGEGGMPERRPPPGTPGISSGFQVVVHNLPWNCTWQNLKDAFAESTQNIERADVITDNTGRSRGFGTVRYASKEDAEQAVEQMNNAQIGGRTVTVRIDRYA
ncbi:hypothetical protein WJX81_003539 [Elliptochloris bilobata]|uniref:Uncharacterized protein n=1 Tax=Elliptochloris bilobata TaxID=381761 RepID=A0AAW1RR83_9CHLO